jgi:hypothetical protein
MDTRNRNSIAPHQSDGGLAEKIRVGSFSLLVECISVVMGLGEIKPTA